MTRIDPDETDVDTEKSPDTTVSDDSPPEPIAPGTTSRRSVSTTLRRLMLPGLSAAVVAALAVTTWWTHGQTVDDRDRTALDSRYLSAARQMVVNLITVDPTDAKAVTDRILDGGTGDFRNEFASRADSFVSVVQQASVTTKGTVTEAGIERSDEGTARVLVAATSTVTNGAGADNEPRVWRLRLTLSHDGTRILTSKVDFAV